MDAQDDTQKTTQPAGGPAAKRTYRRPEILEFGDVRELTRGGGATKSDKRSFKQV